MGFLSCPLCEHVTLADLQELQLKLAKSLSRNLTCPICSTIIQGLTSLHYHLAKHIPIKSPAIRIINPSSPEQIPSLERLDIRDEPQGKDDVINDTASLSSKGHQKIVHHNCDLCGLVFSSEYFLALHKDIVHSNSNGYEVTCKICESSFKDLEEYRDHVREAHSERPYICDRCPKSFKMKGGLLVHTRMYHDNSLPSTCQICHKYFTSKGLKELHEKRYHLNNKQSHSTEPCSTNGTEKSNCLGEAKTCLENLMHQTSQSPSNSPYQEQTNSPQTSINLNSPPTSDILSNRNPHLSNKIEQNGLTTIESTQITEQIFTKEQVKTSKVQKPKKQKNKPNINKQAQEEQANRNNFISPEIFLQLVTPIAGATPTIGLEASPQLVDVNNHQQGVFSQPQTNNSSLGSYYANGANYFVHQSFNGAALDSYTKFGSSVSTAKSENIMPEYIPSQEMINYRAATFSQENNINSATLMGGVSAPISVPNTATAILPQGLAKTFSDYMIHLPSAFSEPSQTSVPIPQANSESQNKPEPQAIKDTTSTPVGHSQKKNDDPTLATPSKKDDGNTSKADNKQWECDTCKKSFTTKYFLKKHKRLHTGETPYSCEECGKTFVFQQSYHKHIFYHSDDKPHQCPHCGRAFKEMSTLHNHIRIHTGEKPFICNTCGKAFRQRVSYFVHQRIHTGQMPYKCEICQRVFRYKVSLRSHKCSGKTMEKDHTQASLEANPQQRSAENNEKDTSSIKLSEPNIHMELTQNSSAPHDIEAGPSTPKNVQWFVPHPSLSTTSIPSFGEPNNNYSVGELTPKECHGKNDVANVAMGNVLHSKEVNTSVALTSSATPLNKETLPCSNAPINFPNNFQLDSELDNEMFLRSLFS